MNATVTTIIATSTMLLDHLGQYLHCCLTYKMVFVNSSFLFPSFLWILCLDSETMDSKSTLSPMEMSPSNRLSVLSRCHVREAGMKVLGFWACGPHQTNEISPDTVVLPRSLGIQLCDTGGAAPRHRCGPFFSETKGQSSRGSDFKDIFKLPVIDYLTYYVFYTYVYFSKLPS